jgi:hypothetical protein
MEGGHFLNAETRRTRRKRGGKTEGNTGENTEEAETSVADAFGIS